MTCIPSLKQCNCKFKVSGISESITCKVIFPGSLCWHYLSSFSLFALLQLLISLHFRQNKDKKVEICRLSTIPMKFIKFLTSFLKLPAWISSNFVSLFSVMTHNFTVKFQSVIGTEQVQEVFTPSTAPVKSTNCLYHVWKYQPNFWEIWH